MNELCRNTQVHAIGTYLDYFVKKNKTVNIVSKRHQYIVSACTEYIIVPLLDPSIHLTLVEVHRRFCNQEYIITFFFSKVFIKKKHDLLLSLNNYCMIFNKNVKAIQS